MNRVFSWPLSRLSRGKSALLLFVCLAIMSSSAHAQVTTATFYGIVADPSGAAIPGAKVTLTHEGTRTVAEKTTDAAGEFAFNFLPVGLYTLHIEAQGFKVLESRGMELLAAQNVRRSFALEIGLVTQTVAVNDEAMLVNTVAAEQRESFSSLDVTQLPVAKRNYSTLLAVGTGVTYANDSRGTGARLNGLGRHGTSITMDGTNANGNPEGRSTSMYQGFNYIDTVSVEAIQEVQTVKGIVPAEYGQTLAGNVNVNTKSGTNKFHGSAFENFQAENLNARNQFLAQKAPLTFNQFGSSLGGPIRRDRVFVFGAYEGYREAASSVVSGNVPSERLRNAMIAAVPDFKYLLATLPLPSEPYDPKAATGFFRAARTKTSTENHAVVKGDLRFWNNSAVALTYTRGNPYQSVPRVSPINDRAWTGTYQRGTATLVKGGAHWTAETRFGYNWTQTDRVDGYYLVTDPKRPGSQPGLRSLPDISVLGMSVGGGEGFYFGGPVWTLEEKVAVISGRHSFKTGFLFSHRGAGHTDTENPAIQYDTEANLLANIPNRIRISFGMNDNSSRMYEFGFFGQDDWRVNPRLVVNLGLRYDFFSNFVARPTDPAAPAGLFNLDGLRDDRFTFGPFRDPQNPFNSDRVNVGPRLGFSYNPDGKSANVIRGGFGVMFSPLMSGVFNNYVANSPTAPLRVDYAKTEASALGLKFPVYNQDVLPLVQASSQIQTAAIFDPLFQAPYSMNLYFGLQRTLTSSLMLESAFVGNRGVKFMMYRVFNAVDRVTGLRPNPKLGEGVYLDDSQNTLYTSWQTSLRKRYSHNFSAAIHYTWGKALSYTGGDIGSGFQGDATSIVQDFFNWRAERGPSTGDVKHYVAADWVYEVPRLSGLGNALARQALGDWQFSGILQAQTGDALTLSQPSGILNSRPDYIGGDTIRSDYRKTLVYLNTNAFRPVPTVVISGATVRPGNIGNGALRGPGLWNLNLSVGKNVAIRESLKFQVRADLFNSLNHTNLGNPGTNITSASFGRITGTRGTRSIQLNARISF